MTLLYYEELFQILGAVQDYAFKSDSTVVRTHCMSTEAPKPITTIVEVAVPIAYSQTTLEKRAAARKAYYQKNKIRLAANQRAKWAEKQAALGRTVRVRVPGRVPRHDVDYYKQYYLDNKEKILQGQKDRRKRRMEQLNLQKKEIV